MAAGVAAGEAEFALHSEGVSVAAAVSSALVALTHCAAAPCPRWVVVPTRMRSIASGGQIWHYGRAVGPPPCGEDGGPNDSCSATTAIRFPGPQWGRKASIAINGANVKRAGRTAIANAAIIAQYPQTPRRADLKSAQCRFESDWGHRKVAGQLRPGPRTSHHRSRAGFRESSLRRGFTIHQIEYGTAPIRGCLPTPLTPFTTHLCDGDCF